MMNLLLVGLTCYCPGGFIPQRDLQVTAARCRILRCLSPYPKAFLIHADRLADESSPAIDEDHSMNESLKAAESGEQLHEQQNKKTKIKQQPRNKHQGKAISRRQSLAGSGTSFDAEGRRRSTRIRSRPLEFWKGERFLYGRVHSSLATVIGIKYESPGKGDGLKVKSFVSDEYKELIEQAARF
ncbi:hypothetical protein V6N12_029824 [Hibiscus sabdariffa]|uniref:Centromere protein C n=1 Tax=Hibiscus sabdariffa TaxID=183260 RepID=A0ABR2CX94_9ROSI